MNHKKPKVDLSKFTREDLLKIFSKCRSHGDSARFLNVTQKGWTARWKEVGLPAPRVTAFKPADEDLPGYHEVGIVSDFHWGSLWQQKTAVLDFCEQCKNRGIETLLNGGDLTDGIMTWPTHEKERFLHSAESYEEYLEQWYPEGFKMSSFITGNHDSSLKLLEGNGYDFGASLVKLRKDLSYHVQNGNDLSDQFVIDGGVTVTLYHGRNSCSNPMMKQNREFRLQSKVLEMMSQGCDDSGVFCFGHCHKISITSFMGKVIIGLPCFQETTPYALSRGSLNDVGGMILKYNSIDNHIVRFSVDFAPVTLGNVLKNDY